jgi:hypothetical protein
MRIEKNWISESHSDERTGSFAGRMESQKQDLPRGRLLQEHQREKNCKEMQDKCDKKSSGNVKETISNYLG